MPNLTLHFPFPSLLVCRYVQRYIDTFVTNIDISLLPTILTGHYEASKRSLKL